MSKTEREFGNLNVRKKEFEFMSIRPIFKKSCLQRLRLPPGEARFWLDVWLLQLLFCQVLRYCRVVTYMVFFFRRNNLQAGLVCLKTITSEIKIHFFKKKKSYYFQNKNMYIPRWNPFSLFYIAGECSLVAILKIFHS